MKNLKLSVHQLVDFLLRSGDIDNRIFNKTSMQEGSRLHAIYQNKQNEFYQAEIPLEEVFEVDDYHIVLQGRADGIFKRNNKCIIDEIKTTVIDLNDFYNSQKEWHLGQAICYGYMFAKKEKLSSVTIRLTYLSQINDDDILLKEFSYSFKELEEKVYSYLHEYLDFYNIISKHIINRNLTSKDLNFPFPHFRNGQRELSKYVYAISKDGGVLYAEAPTGIGKTMSTLFPTCKTFALNENEKIFYLTAKNSGKESAFNAINILKMKGLDVTSILISSKEKMCLCSKSACNPDECVYTKNYYNKVKSVLVEMLLNDSSFNQDLIMEYALKYKMCPFELQLDLSLYCDIIVCDYNYLFDPLVYMKRYFDEDSSSYIALIDEAHNLVDRSRSMYSSNVSYSKFLKVKSNRQLKEFEPLAKAIRRINKLFKSLKKDEDYFQNENDINESNVNALNAFLKASQSFMKYFPSNVDEDFKDFFFDVNAFIKILDYYDDHFTFIIKQENEEIVYSIYCLDASNLVKKKINMLKGAVIFSATLAPSEYYISMLGGDEKSYFLRIPSPFPQQNLNLIIAPNVSTKYKNREATKNLIAKYITSFVSQKIGNYLVFFPSYKYMLSIYQEMENKDNIILQTSEMNEKDKEEYLAHFSFDPTFTTIGFAVLGGSFSEGIDLYGNRLIGAIIVGGGLPMISFELDLIKQYFDSKEKNGYEYAYSYPGMNKVMQAVGRVIRSENDKGSILLLDERYLHNDYRKMFRKEWEHYKVAYSEKEVEKLNSDFFFEKNNN